MRPVQLGSPPWAAPLRSAFRGWVPASLFAPGEAAIAAISPLSVAAQRSLPPILILTGGADEVVPAGQQVHLPHRAIARVFRSLLALTGKASTQQLTYPYSCKLAWWRAPPIRTRFSAQERFADVARSAGSRVTLLRFEGAPHGGGGVNCAAGRAAVREFLAAHGLRPTRHGRDSARYIEVSE